MGTVGACSPLVRMNVGLAGTLCDGITGCPFSWHWRGLCCEALGGLAGRTLVGRSGGGVCGLQLLATTVLSLSSSLARMWNGLLLRVCRWCISGICLMTFGAVILLDVVATLGGGAFTTLVLGASTL